MLSSASRCIITTILHLHNTILQKSATPYAVPSREITMGFNLDLSQRFPGGVSQENIFLKPTFKSLPRPTPTSKRNIMRMKAQTPKFNCHIFFFFWGVCPVLLVIPFCWYWQLPDGLYFLNLNSLFCGSVAHCITVNASSYSFKTHMLGTSLNCLRIRD